MPPPPWTAEYLPQPLMWSYIGLFVLTVASLITLLVTSDDRPPAKVRWRPQVPFVPVGIGIGFVVATLAAGLAYCVGAIFLSLGAHMTDQFTHTDNLAIVGALLAASSAFIGVAGIFPGRAPEQRPRSAWALWPPLARSVPRSGWQPSC